MDLEQRKLNKSEWETIEVPVLQSEIDVLKMIINGFTDVNIKFNKTITIFTFLKIEYNEKMEDYLYDKFLSSQINELIKLYKLENKIKIDINSKMQIKTADKIRLENTNNISMKDKDIYEFVLLFHVEQTIKFRHMVLSTSKKFEENKKSFLFHYYTLFKLNKNSIKRINRHMFYIVNKILKLFEE